MTEIIGVRFKSGGKQYYFDPKGTPVAEGQGVIVETTRGTEFGQCVQGNTPIDEMELTAPLRPVVRPAGPEDLITLEKNRELFDFFRYMIRFRLEHPAIRRELPEAEYDPAARTLCIRRGIRPREGKRKRGEATRWGRARRSRWRIWSRISASTMPVSVR